MVSIIIPSHNEGAEFIRETIDGIKNTCDVSPFEIIIVDDCSDEPLSLKEEGVKIVRHTKNQGVGVSFDDGVALSKYENLILMGADIRLTDNNWASMMIKEIQQHPTSIVCTTCIGLNDQKPENMIMANRMKNRRTGATIIMFHDHSSNPLKPENFRGILEAKWLPLIDSSESVEIPCILGACYSVKKQWYRYMDGWHGHRIWGTLEPMISLKSWLFGGSCRVAPQIETAHIFGRGGHYIRQEDVLFNKMYVAMTLMDDPERFVEFLGDNDDMRNAKVMIDSAMDDIMRTRKEYEKKKVMSAKEFCSMFEIDYRI